jgi:putative transposase
MAAVAELANDVGTSSACQALCMSRASYYRDGRKTSSPAVSASRPSPARALRPAEREVVLSRLHEERFQDRSPTAVYATLLDEGEYHCSIRTMYRLLDEQEPGEVLGGIVGNSSLKGKTEGLPVTRGKSRAKVTGL